MTTNPATARLRWLLLGILLIDMGLTLLGQPASFWRDPSTAVESNPLVTWFMHRGYVVTIVSWLAFIAASFGIVSFLPRRLGSVMLYAFLLGAFAASSSWVVWRFELGMAGLYFYSFVVAIAWVCLTEEERPNKAPEPTPTSVTPPAKSR